MTASAIFSAIIAAIKAIPIVEEWYQRLMVAYISALDAKTQGMIADAAAIGANAQTDEDRFNASKAWQDALIRPRITK